MRRLAVALLTLGALTGCGGRAFAGAAPPVGTAPAEATPEAPPLVKIPGTGVIWKICRVAGGGEDEQDN